jgi:hypothetical protein
MLLSVRLEAHSPRHNCLKDQTKHLQNSILAQGQESIMVDHDRSTTC